MAKAEGRVFKFDGEEVINPDFLETFEFKSEQLIEIETSEFTAVCPFSGLPDIANVTIRYIPTGKALELKALKYYFLSYRSAGVYQERVTQLIRKHLEEALETDVLVVTTYNTRGGINVRCQEGQLKKCVLSNAIEEIEEDEEV